MKLFSADEIELIRLEAGRKRIADLREKLKRMKRMASVQVQEKPGDADNRQDRDAPPIDKQHH